MNKPKKLETESDWGRKAWIKKIVLITLVFLATLVSGCVDKNNLKDIDVQWEDCKVLSELEKLECAQNLAVEIGNEGVCNRLENTLRQEQCIAHVAGETEDIELCDYISLESPNTLCIKKVAVALRDYSTCEKIQDEYYKNTYCYGEISRKLIEDANKLKKLEICQRINNDYRKLECIFTVSVNTNNVEECERINLETYTNACNVDDDFCKIQVRMWHDTCINQIATVTKNTAICQNLNHQIQIDSCVASAEGRHEEYGEQLTEEIVEIQQKAIAEGDEKICEQLNSITSSNAFVELCKIDVAKAKEDISICEELTTYKETCKERVKQNG